LKEKGSNEQVVEKSGTSMAYEELQGKKPAKKGAK